jgi:hypothetical protein
MDWFDGPDLTAATQDRGASNVDQSVTGYIRQQTNPCDCFNHGSDGQVNIAIVALGGNTDTVPAGSDQPLSASLDGSSPPGSEPSFVQVVARQKRRKPTHGGCYLGEPALGGQRAKRSGETGQPPP